MLFEHILIYWIGAFWLMRFKCPSMECVKNVLFNQIIVNTLLFTMLDFKMDAHPSFASIPVVYLMEELGFYWMHRAFHHPYLYKYHKIHHRWTRPEPYAALDCHPLEHALVNMFPILIGPWVFDWSYAWVWTWTMMATISTIRGHRGEYETLHHVLHHKHGNCNYGNAGVMDVLFKSTHMEQ